MKVKNSYQGRNIQLQLDFTEQFAEEYWKWSLTKIFLFATMGDIYVLTDPSFDTRKECMDFLIEQRPKKRN